MGRIGFIRIIWVYYSFSCCYFYSNDSEEKITNNSLSIFPSNRDFDFKAIPLETRLRTTTGKPAAGVCTRAGAEDQASDYYIHRSDTWVLNIIGFVEVEERDTANKFRLPEMPRFLELARFQRSWSIANRTRKTKTTIWNFLIILFLHGCRLYDHALGNDSNHLRDHFPSALEMAVLSTQSKWPSHL